MTSSNSINDLVVRFAGESGEGVVSLGELVTTACHQLGLETLSFRTFPAEIRGGTVIYQLRAKQSAPYSWGDKPDILFALTQNGYDLNWDDVKTDGILLYDSDSIEPKANGHKKTVAVPVTHLAKEVIGAAITKNMVAFGAIWSLIGDETEVPTKLIARQFNRKGDAVIEKNIAAFNLGYTRVCEQINGSLPKLKYVENKQERLLLTGNEAIALGSLAGGVKFFAGYPITPATEILEMLSKEMPRFGGDVVQAEDEIAAIGMCLGASFVGKKAMTATSGPGLSLMVEQINLASQAEIPIVIVNVQRAGASTGMPTKTSQGDLNLAVYGVHNESPRVVLAPTSVEDCFYIMMRAFNYAERYQIPVIVLSEQSLANRRQSIPILNPKAINIWQRIQPIGETPETYQRYRNTEDGVSPMTWPGRGPTYMASGIEHDEWSDPTYDPMNALTMKKKRFRKLESIAEGHSAGAAKYVGDNLQVSDVGVIGWGSTEGPIREAIEAAEAEGYKVAHLQPKMLNPLPVDLIRNFASKVKKVLVPELNFTGQFASIIRAQCGIETISYARDNGLPFRPSDILGAIKEVARK